LFCLNLKTMKKLILSIAAIMIAFALKAQTWTAAQVTGTTENLRGVCMTSATNAYACGFNSTIAKTTDGGINWTATVFPGGFNLFSVDFASATTGLVVGDNGISPGGQVNCAVIKRTTNGGNSWTDITAPDTGNYWLRAVAFADASTAIAVGSNGKIIRSTDAGASWTSISSPSNQTLWDVNFPTASTGYAVESYYTGSSYSTRVLKTSDGGITWTAIGSSISGLAFAISFISDTEGWLAVSGEIFGTTDGGSTWTQLCSNTGIQSNDILFLSSGNGRVGGSYLAVRTSTDGGITWSTETSGSSGSINALSFINATTGIAVGDGGTILRYTPSVVGLTDVQARKHVLQLYPNPVKDLITAELKTDFTGAVDVQVLDLTGRTILTGTLSGNKIQLDISELPEGCYFFMVSEGEVKRVAKFIKQD
jgi:photosystem II stability/assembly factor-like uncharacterized protein